MIDRKIELVLSCNCCMKRNGNGVIALRANSLIELITKMDDIKSLTIGEALTLKSILGLTDSEAIAIFLGGMNYENVQV